MRRGRRVALIVVGALLALPILLLLAGFAFLQTRSGQDWLGATLAAQLSTPDNRIEVEGLSGAPPFDLRAATIRLADRDGVWASVAQAQLLIDGWALLRGELRITALTADSIEVARLPTARPSAPSKTPLELRLEPPHLPLAVAVERLAVGRLTLAKPVLGEPAALALTADAGLSGGNATLHLDLHRIDQQAGNAQVALSLAGRPAQLALQAEVSEPTGLLLARLLQRPERAPLRLTLNGSGPLADWRGKLAAEAGSLLQLQADLGLAGGNGYRFTMAGEARQAGLLPAKLQPLIGDRIHFAAAGSYGLGGGEVAVLDRLTLNAAALALTGDLRLDNASQTVAGTAHLSLPDLGPAEALVQAPTAGRLELDARLAGSVAEPRLNLTLAGESGRVATLGVDRLSATLQIDGQAVGGARNWRVAGQGHLAGLTRDGAPLPADLGNAVDWSVAGLVDPRASSLSLDHLSVTGAGLDLAAAGDLSPRASQGTLKLAVAELGNFGALAGLPKLSGQVALDADLSSDSAYLVKATLRATASDLVTGIPAADALLGRRVEITAEAAREDGGQISASGVGVTGAGASFQGSGMELPGADRSADQLAGKLGLSLPDLAVLGPALGGRFRGKADLAAEIGGSPAHASLRLTLAGRDLGTARALARKLDATVEIADLSQPSGRLQTTFAGTPDAGNIAGRVEAEFARPEPDLIRISRLVATAGGARLAGNLDYALAARRATGKLTGSVADLAAWSTLAGQPLAGRADLAATLAARGDQSLDLKLTASGLSIGSGAAANRVGRLSLLVNAGGLMGRPNGRADLEITDAGSGNLHLTRTTFQTRANGTAAATFNGHAEGQMTLPGARADMRIRPLSVDLAGSWASVRSGQQITLAKLAAALGPDRATLTRKLMVSIAPGSYRFDDLALDIAGGRLDGNGALDGRGMTLKLDLAHLPLAPFGRLAGQKLAGRIDMAADLSGPLQAPRGKVTLAGRELQLTGASQSAALPTVGFDLAATPGPGQLTLQGSVTSRASKLLALAGRLPLRITTKPLSIGVPRDQAIDLTADGEGRIETIAELLPIGDDHPAGQYRIALSVKGTLAAPQPGGRLAVENGSYVNQEFGTTIKNLNIELVGNRNRLEIARCSATDAKNGQLTAEGAVDFAASPAPRLDFKAKLSRFQAADSDNYHAVVDADFQLAGTLDQPRVAAQIQVPRGEFFIPDRLPPSVVTINVVRIDSRDPEAAARKLAAARKQATTSQRPTLATLDIKVTIPGQTFVRGHGLDSEWRGNIAITGSNAAPQIAGKLEAVRGTIDLLGKTFTIQRGTIDFPSGSLGDPRIDLLAEYDASDITAQVAITGSPTAPRLTLSSQPQLPQDQILSRVLFGSDVGQITAAQGVELALAARNLATGGPGLLDTVRSTLGLDRLSLGASPTTNPTTNLPQASMATGVPPTLATSGTAGSTQNTTSPTLSGGKYVAPGVYVGVDQGTSPQSTRAKVEIEMTRSLGVYSAVGANSGSQIGVDWHHDY